MFESMYFPQVKNIKVDIVSRYHRIDSATTGEIWSYTKKYEVKNKKND